MTLSAAGNPARVFDTAYAEPFDYTSRPYDVSPDGQRFLMIKESAANRNATHTDMVVVLNWFEELKAELPAGR